MWKLTKNNYGVVIHNWNGNVRFGLPLEIGDFVEILEENGGWFRGKRISDSQTFGIFPKSFIRIKLKDLSKDDRLLDECTETLRVWYDIWKKLFVKNDVHQFIELQSHMISLIKSCNQLRQTVFSEDEISKLQAKITSIIDLGNRKMGLDLVPRSGTFSVNEKNSGIMLLHQAHKNSSEKSRVSLTQERIYYKEEENDSNYHLHFVLREFKLIYSDDLEIYLHLYDANPSKMRTISERFLINIPGKEEFQCNEIHSTIFTDLALTDIQTNLFIIITIIRVGKMSNSELFRRGSNTVKVNYRRPYVMGVCNLSEKVKTNNIFDQSIVELPIKFYMSDEKNFFHLHEFIIQKETEKYRPITSAEIKSDMILTMKILNGNINQIISASPLLSVTRKIGFGEIFVPSDIRNDLFLTLENGIFEIGGKSAQKNIEVTVIPLGPSGKVIPNCLWSASNLPIDATNFRSLVTYHNNTPNFNEHVRIDIPPKIIHDAHILFEFRHCSSNDKTKSKVFGFSFLRITRANSTAIPNGLYDLYVYKCCVTSEFLSAGYLKLPCYQHDDRTTQHACTIFQKSVKETFRINIFLCSMKLSQNVDIVSLLKWRLNPSTLYDSLTGLLKLENEELIKFLTEILEALFGIFTSTNGSKTEYSGLVFHILINIFNLLRTQKFQNYLPIIDDYIENKFICSSVHNALLSSIEKSVINLSAPIEPIRKCFESLEYIFKFMIKSKKLENLKRKSTTDEIFQENLHSVFSNFYKILKIEKDERMLNIQIILLKTIGVIFEELKGIQPASELVNIATNLINAIPKEDVPELIQAKLQSIKDLICGHLFRDNESRIIILLCVCTHVRHHILRENELNICYDILNTILMEMIKIRNRDSSKEFLEELKIICKNMFMIIIQNILNQEVNIENILAPIVTVLLGLFQELNQTDYSLLWNLIGTNGDSKELLLKILLIFKKLVTLNWEVFPNDWFSMKLAANNIIRKALEEFEKQLSLNYLNDDTFDCGLWLTYFSLTVSFITQPCLQLEQFEEIKRSKTINAYGDMRVSMGIQLLSMWSKLGKHKLDFLPSMIGPFLEVTLISELTLRKTVLPVFYDMMECEQLLVGTLQVVQNELIDKLDVLINKNKGDMKYKDLFCSVLLQKINAENPTWKDASAGFISSVTELLQILLDYRSVLEGSENREKRMSCIVNLLNFYKDDIHKRDKYLSYIYKLHDLHIEAKDYTEAGFTLKLYFDMLTWNADTLTYDPRDSTYLNEWKLKQKLCYQIITLFDKGKCWEKAIPLCKRLNNFHETRSFSGQDIKKTCLLYLKYVDNIFNKDRQAPEYFQVNFYGMGYPSFVRNKKFIYRGYELEKISDFTQRIQYEFPRAEILKKSTTPEKSIFTSSCQFLQITCVHPITNVEYFKNAVAPVPDRIKKFYLVNDINCFKNDRPIHKGTIDKNNEFKTMWIERTILETDQSLPGILRWFEVAKSTTEEISPIQFACETMEKTNNELLDLIVQYQQDSTRSLNPLTMRLQGVIEANVQGGTSKYEEAFLNNKFSNDEKHNEFVLKLKSLNLLQLQILEKALTIHGTNATADLMPLHEALVKRLNERKQIDSIERPKKFSHNSIVHSPLPSLPFEENLIQINKENNNKEEIYEDAIYEDAIYEDAIYGEEIYDCIKEPINNPDKLIVKQNKISHKETDIMCFEQKDENKLNKFITSYSLNKSNYISRRIINTDKYSEQNGINNCSKCSANDELIYENFEKEENIYSNVKPLINDVPMGSTNSDCETIYSNTVLKPKLPPVPSRKHLDNYCKKIISDSFQNELKMKMKLKKNIANNSVSVFKKHENNINNLDTVTNVCKIQTKNIIPDHEQTDFLYTKLIQQTTKKLKPPVPARVNVNKDQQNKNKK